MAKVMLIQLNNTGGLRGNTVLQRWRLTNLLIATLNAPSGLLQYVVEEFDEAIPEELFDSDDALARRFDLRVHVCIPSLLLCLGGCALFLLLSRRCLRCISMEKWTIVLNLTSWTSFLLTSGLTTAILRRRSLKRTSTQW